MAKGICLLCCAVFESGNPIYKSTKKYCYACRIKIRDRHDQSVDSPKKKGGDIITDNLDWYNAGVFAGKQGYLRDRFYELFSKSDDFLKVMFEIRKDSKYLAEIKGLDDSKRRSFLIGFFSSINQREAPFETVIIESEDD